MSIGVVHARVWINGERQSDEGPHVSARDRGLTLGDGVFETMFARRGTIFRLGRHLARLERGLTALDIAVPPALLEWTTHAVEAEGRGDMAVRLTVTRGPGPAGVSPPEALHPTVVISVGPMPSFPESTFNPGLTAHVASGRRNEHAMTAGLKTVAYADAVAALLEARRAGAEEALFLDTQGHCSEATASNLFAWIGGTLVTPPISCGALPGITREAVLELAKVDQVAVAERPLALTELLAADEAFLTSSLRGIAPLARIGERALGRMAPGALTRRLGAAYLALVDRECGV